MRATDCSDVAAAFDAADDYVVHARVQRRIAQMLGDLIAADLAVHARAQELTLLEIGCGTGFLTDALLVRELSGNWLITDIAPAMVRRCATTMAENEGTAKLSFAVMDGELPLPHLSDGGFDLVCSNLAFQWFADLPAALRRIACLVAPGGLLAFSTLVAGTLDEWDAAHRRVGLNSRGLVYPDLEDLACMFPPGGSLALRERIERERYIDGCAFLQSIKGTGAGTNLSGRRPLSVRELRHVMTEFEADGAFVTYRVAHCLWRRSL